MFLKTPDIIYVSKNSGEYNMRYKIKVDDNGKQYLLKKNEPWNKEAKIKGKQARKDLEDNKLTVLAIKAKLAINITQLKKYCRENNIDFIEDKVFNKNEYELIKSSAVYYRNKKIK